MKKALLVALMGLMTIITANAAVDFQNITITLKNGQVIKYDASQLDHVTYVGGEFGKEGAVGIKLYITATSSEDYLYSQITSIVYDTQESTVAAPTFSPTGGNYSVAQTVTITTTTSGATIYYTTDGTTPTTNSTHYTAAITVSTTTTIKAIAVKDGVSSAVATATFTINSGSTTDNNVNANWHEALYNSADDHDDFTSSRATCGRC